MNQTSMNQILYQKFDSASEMGFLNSYKNLPKEIKDNLNPAFEIRNYQKEAFGRFIYYLKSYPEKQIPAHLLFNMATGSGKTLIMAGLILYLYKQGYRNFLFFVNSSNIVSKTKENFINSLSSKYLFNQKISIESKAVRIKEGQNFEESDPEGINICLTTIQKLHGDLIQEKENSIIHWA